MNITGDTTKARLIAAFIDHMLAFALMLLIVALMPEDSALVKGSLFFLAYLAYYIILEATWSRTLGKYFQGLVVRKLDGSACDWRASLIRGATRLIEVNPLLLGGLPAGLVIISTRRKQRVGDLLAGTIVVSAGATWDEAP